MGDLRLPYLNHITIAGRMTHDPELRYLTTGMAVCTFNIAVSRKWKDKSGDSKEEVLFIKGTAWGKTAEWLGDGTLHKGHSILAEGRLKMEDWEDKETGKRRTQIYINADKVQCLEWKGDFSKKKGAEGDDSGPENEPQDDDVAF